MTEQVLNPIAVIDAVNPISALDINGLTQQRRELINNILDNADYRKINRQLNTPGAIIIATSPVVGTLYFGIRVAENFPEPAMEDYIGLIASLCVGFIMAKIYQIVQQRVMVDLPTAEDDLRQIQQGIVNYRINRGVTEKDSHVLALQGLIREYHRASPPSQNTLSYSYKDQTIEMPLETYTFLKRLCPHYAQAITAIEEPSPRQGNF